MRIYLIVCLLFVTTSNGQNPDLLWRARGLQANYNIDSLNNLLSSGNLNKDLYDSIRCLLHIERSYSLYATDSVNLYKSLRLNNYFHLFNFSYPDSASGDPLDVGYYYNKDGTIGMATFRLPKGWLALHADDGILFKPIKSNLILYYSAKDPFDVQIFNAKKKYSKQ